MPAPVVAAPAASYVVPAVAGFAGSLISSAMENSASKRAAQQQAHFQEEFAKKGIRWRVRDAIKAGIHPLAALGANTISYSPVSVGTSTPDFGKFGQDITRAMFAKSTPEERILADINLRLKAEELKQAGISTGILQEELRKLRSVPGMPSPRHDAYGTVESFNPDMPGMPGVSYQDMEIPYSSQPGFAAGAYPQNMWVVTADGGVDYMPGEEIGDAMDSDIFQKMKYAFGRAWNHSSAIVNGYLKPTKWVTSFVRELRNRKPNLPLGKDEEWRYHPGKDKWYRTKRNGRSCLFVGCMHGVRN